MKKISKTIQILAWHKLKVFKWVGGGAGGVGPIPSADTHKS